MATPNREEPSGAFLGALAAWFEVERKPGERARDLIWRCKQAYIERMKALTEPVRTAREKGAE